MKRETLEARAGGTAHLETGESWWTAIARYLFGPAPTVELGAETLLAEIRRLGGLVVAADVMRVTGLSRARAEGLLCRLLARQGGDVEVGLAGGVLYRFADVAGRARVPGPIWNQPLRSAPITGNETAVDLVLVFINLLLLALSGTALARTWSHMAWRPVLVLVPFLLSALALVLPLCRLHGRRARAQEAAVENGRRGLLRAVLERPVGAPLGAHALSHAWAASSGQAIRAPQLIDEVRALGGELDVDEQARLQFRFVTLDEELSSLVENRAEIAV
jgi:hypothetical protein